MAHPLDNILWNTLNGPHAEHSLDFGDVRLYRPGFLPAAGMRQITDANFATLAAAVPAGTTLAMSGPAPITPTSQFAVEHVDELLQMVGDTLTAFTAPIAVTDLGPADFPAMQRLVDIAKPGPLVPRALELGGFVGIFDGDDLVALAGERLRPEGFAELSTICTHPGFRGRDYGKTVVSAVAQRIAARGETPFLVVYPQNGPAIRLYESMGFVARSSMFLTVFKRL
jgi:ribosomal protein S18 acetylase RimI-like enzyme